jgi:hypothetical protein
MYICLLTVASPVNNTSEFRELFETTAYRPVHILYIYNHNCYCLASHKHKFTDKVVFSASEALRIDDLVLVYMYD